MSRPALKIAPTLESLTHDWLATKARESEANAERLAIEQQIVTLVPSNGTEGAATREVGTLRVSVRYSNTRKVDSDALQRLWPALAPEAQAAFVWKATPTLPKLRALQELRPDVYAKLVPILDVKPAKPAVTVEPI